MTLSLAQVRRLCCAKCGAAAPSHAHHLTGRGKGLGTKNPDDQSIPLCAKCHHDLHDLTGSFKGWEREQLRSWQESKRNHVHGLTMFDKRDA